jgi:arylsulfatase A-like enzyme
LICFSDFFPTIVEAAGLPARKIANGDGWSFWPQCLGNPGKERDWIYLYYFPRPYSQNFDDKFKHREVRYARDKRYKLYDNGALYDTLADVLEQNPLIITEKLMPIQRKLQSVLDRYPNRSAGIDYVRVKGTYSSD